MRRTGRRVRGCIRSLSIVALVPAIACSSSHNTDSGVAADTGHARLEPAQPLQAESSTSTPDIPRVAINAQGKGAVVWLATDNMTTHSIRGAVFSRDQGFIVSSTATIEAGVANVSVASLSSGDTVVIYSTLNQLEGRTFSAAGQWGAPVVISNEPQGVGPADLVSDDDDNLTLIWGSGTMLKLSRNSGQGFTTPATLGPSAGLRSVAVDGAGNISIVTTADPQVTLRRIAKNADTWTDPVIANDGDGQLAGPPAVVSHDATGNPLIAYPVASVGPMGQSRVHIHWKLCR